MGANDFGQVLIPPTSGAMTANSFEFTGWLTCQAYLPVCNPWGDPMCSLEEQWSIFGCSTHERKTLWQFCEGY